MLRNEQQSKLKLKKRFFTTLILFVFTIQIFLLIPKPAQALFGVGDISFTTITGDIPGTIWRGIDKLLEEVTAKMFKDALRTFVQQMAYKVATKIASGAAGQKPLFTTKDFTTALKESGDAAVGDFLDTLSTEAWGFSLCDIDPAIRIDIETNVAIDLGLAEPRKAKCTGSDILDGITSAQPLEITGGIGLGIAGQDPAQISRALLRSFPEAFSPEGNNLGQYLNIHSQAKIKKEEAKKEEEKEQEKEFLPLKSIITGDTKTPAAAIEKTFELSLFESVDPETNFTGSLAADFIGIFTNTFIKKYLEAILTKGLNPQADYSSKGLADFLSTQGASGIAAAEARFASFLQPNLGGASAVDILNKLSSCPSTFTEVENCVMDSNFRTAVEQHLRLEEAIEKGYLDGNKPFGFGQGGAQLDYKNGYPYRSLVIMRRHRIVPVSWELAALYVRNFGAQNITLNALMDAFDDPLSPYYHLVDPDWVLKAPDNYCRQKGFGEGLQFSEYFDHDGFTATPKVQQIERQEICVDDQSCIEENPDGTCLAYGYCTKEQPIWKFSGEACPDYYSSCKNYQRRDGNQFSYLENTLEFNNCSPDNVGCQWYCKEFNETTNQWQCYWDPATSKYDYYPTGDPWGAGPIGDYSDWLAHLDASAETCDASAEGCSEFIRTTHGTNLLSNSSLEQFEGDPDDGVADYFGFCDENSTNPGIGCLRDMECGGAGICKGWRQEVSVPPTSEAFAVTKDTADVYLGSTALNARDGVELEQRVDTGHSIYQRTFTLSFWAKAQGASDCHLKADIYAYDGGSSEIVLDSVSLTDIPSDWMRYTLTTTVTDDTYLTYNHLVAEIKEAGDPDPLKCGNGSLIDAVMLEESDSASEYVDYGDINQVYLTGERLSCEEDDVGCQWYTPVAGGDPVPAKYTSDDICLAEEVGCKAYEETPLTNVVPDPDDPIRTGKYCSGYGYQDIPCFDNAQCSDIAPERGECLPTISLIPSTGTSCSASFVGCEEYTNLDEVAQGGEGKEYYSFLKQCVPLDDPGIATYYAWEGDEVAGYQLRAFRLKRSNIVYTGETSNAPCTHLEVGQDLPLDCQDTLANVQECSAVYGTDPDCIEFFDSDLNTFFRYKSQTITVSDDCHPERNTLDDDVYYGLPEESTSCPAVAAGCREYKGTAGSNYRIVFNDDFEDGTTQGWTGVENSSESILINGHSIKTVGPYDATITRPLTGDSSVQDKKTYLLSFWAKGSAAPVIIRFDTSTGGTSFFADNDPTTPAPAINLTGADWQEYNFGPVTIDTADTTSWSGVPGNLMISNISGVSYFDNITLTETTQHVYLIRGSANLCQGKENCEAYRNTDGETLYLKSFSKLCEERFAGCEALINTQNTPNPYVEIFGTQTESTIIVPADNTVRFVNNPEVYCNAEDKGCRALGEPEIDAEYNLVDYKTVYFKDNAENYSTIWCENSESGCEEYNFEGGLGKAYFIDPGERVCEYKQKPGDIEYAWYKQGTDPPEPCAPDNTAPNPAPTGPEQPSNDWVGLCEDKSNGCTAYRDPLEPIDCDPSFPYKEDSLGNSIRECSDTSPNPGAPCTVPTEVADCGIAGACLPFPGCQTYYYINSSVDETSCNGTVDEEKGCKLFFNTDVPPNVYTADLSPDGSESGVPEFGVPFNCDDTVSTIDDPNYCDSNKVLQVVRDRVCDEWLYCKTSLEVDDPADSDGDGKTKEEVCFEIGTCGELGTGGTCVQSVNKDPINVTGDDAAVPQNYPFEEFQNYSGFVSAGLQYGCSDDVCQGGTNDGTDCDDNSDCTGGGTCTAGASISCTVATETTDCGAGNTCEIIEGYFPYSAMYEVGLGGASVKDLVFFGDFESDALSDFMVCDASANNEGEACLIDNHCVDQEGKQFGSCTDVNDNGVWQTINPALAGTVTVVEGNNIEGNAALDENNYLLFTPNYNNSAIQGVKSNLGPNILDGQEYIATFDFRFEDVPNPGQEEITVSLAQYDDLGNLVWFEDLEKFDGTTSWQQYIIGPHTIQGIPDETQNTYLAFYNATTRLSFSLDDVSLKPVLTVQQEDANNFNYVARSCRAYPRNDSQACHYIDDDLIEFNGWKGYCLETDPTNPNRCLTWWPVDVISGESTVFGTIEPAGYQGRIPLYYCMESKGLANLTDIPRGTEAPGYILVTRNENANDDSGDSNCKDDDIPPYECVLTESKNAGTYVRDIPPNYYGSGSFTYESPLADGTIRKGDIEKVVFQAREQETDGEWPACNNGDPEDTSGIYIASEVEDPGVDEFDNDGGGPSTWQISGGPCGSGDKNNHFQIRLNFDSEGKFTGYRTWIHDNENGGWVTWRVAFHLRESCQEVAQVVSNLGEERAWAARTTSTSTYPVANLNYTYGSDYAPFGGIAEPDSDPPNWHARESYSSIYAEEPDTVTNNPDVTPPQYQIRSGNPYACEGNCSLEQCLGDVTANPFCSQDKECENRNPGGTYICGGVGVCVDPDTGFSSLTCSNPGSPPDCQGFTGTWNSSNPPDNPNNPFCNDNSDCPQDKGGDPNNDEICLGGAASNQADPLAYAQDRLKRLFADAYGVWIWDNTKNPPRYNNDNTPLINWNTEFNNMRLCNNTGLRPRPDEDLVTDVDYCAILPDVQNILVNGTSGSDVILSGGGEVNLTFTTFVDEEQLALKTIQINWGDGSPVQLVNWDGAPKTDPAAPHSVSHNYSCTSNGYGWDLTYCNARPEIMITDNWGFCNNANTPTGPPYRKCNINGVGPNYDYDFFDSRIRVTPQAFVQVFGLFQEVVPMSFGIQPLGCRTPKGAFRNCLS